MPPKLRPRRQLVPSDHNYAKSLTHLPMYGENSWPVILTGPEGIFQKATVEFKEQPDESGDNEINEEVPMDIVKVPKRIKRSVSESAAALKEETEGSLPKRKRRKFFKGTTFEPKRRRKRKVSVNVAPIAPTALGKETSYKTELSFNDSGIASDLNDSIKAELDQNTNSLKVNSKELPLVDDAILLQPHADTDGVPGLYNLSVANTTQPVKMKRICSTCTSECHWKRKRCPSLQPESDSRRQSERLIKMNYKFPFEDLPDVCKLKIFSYLNLTEKGTAAQVCCEWNRLVKAPGLWSHMNFSIFNPTTVPLKPKSNRNVRTMSNPFFHGQFPWQNNFVEYDDYKNRISKFLDYLREIKPKLRNLTFSYDIGQPKDEWLKWITGFLNTAQCLNLTYANIDWTWTPLRLSSNDRYCCLFNKMQIKYRLHEKRVRCFNELQKVLGKVAPNLAHLKIPFDWSPRSVLLMCRLKQVTTLQLGQYMMLKGIQQEMMESLLRNMPQLKELEMKICSPSHNSTSTYAINHAGLELLDISMCKGFFLHELKCPKLTVLKIGRYPWKGPIVNKETNKLQCIYTLCRLGTPRLAYVNRHHIQAYWVEFLYDELNTVLCKVCSCKEHLYRKPVAVPHDPNVEEQPDNNNAENEPMAIGLQGNIPQVAPELGAAINIVPAVNNAVLDPMDPPLANIVPLFPLMEDGAKQDDVKPSTSGESRPKSILKELGASKYVVDDALPSTSSDPRAQGKSCSKFKAKRSKSLPVPIENSDESSDADDQDIPIEHSTVEVRSTPRINTLPFIGAPTHVAVIPIRVIDPRMISQPSVVNPASIAIQSIALQPQVIAVDKVTGTHVVSGPLTVVKHIIQVIPKATPTSTSSASFTTTTEDKRNLCADESADLGFSIVPAESLASSAFETDHLIELDASKMNHLPELLEPDTEMTQRNSRIPVIAENRDEITSQDKVQMTVPFENPVPFAGDSAVNSNGAGFPLHATDDGVSSDTKT